MLREEIDSGIPSNRDILRVPVRMRYRHPSSIIIDAIILGPGYQRRSPACVACCSPHPLPDEYQVLSVGLVLSTYICSMVSLASIINPCVPLALPLDSILVGMDDPACSSVLQFEKIDYETLLFKNAEHADKTLTRSSSSYRSPSYSRSYYRPPQPIRRYSHSSSSS